MRIKAIIRLLFVSSVVLWLALLFTDLSMLFSTQNGIEPGLPTWLPRIFLNLFILAIYYYYKLKVERDDQLNFVDMLWKVFATGLVATVISLLFRLLVNLIGNTRLAGHVVFYDFIYLVNLGLTISFLLMSFTVWKRLILYHKSKWLIRLWTIFEYGLLASLAYNSFNLPIVEGVYIVLLIIFLLIGLVLSANMKWVAYLNFRQKWTSLLLLLLTVFYMLYGFFTNTTYAESAQSFADHREHIFIISLMSFVAIYSVFSFLVILFNLPTTSAFEQKFEEVINFQRISQSIQTEQSEESVYNILLDTSVKSVMADAAWLEINANPGSRLFTHRISEKEAHDIIQHLNDQHVKGVLDQGMDKTKQLSRHLARLRSSRFRSILAFPIVVKNETIGTIALLKELPEGFNKDMTRIVATFANQAGISIENFRLMEEAFQTERYKEELKIAKRVQKSLLPANLENGDFDIVAFSESADEVGGDYYDTLRISDDEVSLIIADVSGKGTTAAFHMSQMKGIFHSLAQTCIEPEEFMVKANQALVGCLERGSFISACFFLINKQHRVIRYSRAGHCPVLYYCAADNKAVYLEDKGIALGMVRNTSFKKYIQNNEIKYSKGDVLVLYTDGITEATNSLGDEFGLIRLAAAVEEAADKAPQEIQDRIISRLYEFSGSDLNDDYTTMIVKFSD